MDLVKQTSSFIERPLISKGDSVDRAGRCVFFFRSWRK